MGTSTRRESHHQQKQEHLTNLSSLNELNFMQVIKKMKPTAETENCVGFNPSLK